MTSTSFTFVIPAGRDMQPLAAPVSIRSPAFVRQAGVRARLSQALFDERGPELFPLDHSCPPLDVQIEGEEICSVRARWPYSLTSLKTTKPRTNQSRTYLAATPGAG
jgi:hypothetical protein